MGGLNFESTPIAGVYVVQGAVREDARGSFERLFCAEAMAQVRPRFDVVQVNRSVTRRIGAVRGLHYQRAPRAEAKLVRCLHGSVFDVALDLRAGSPTFLRWHAVELRGGDARAYYLPEGVAHGFQALEEDSELLYLHTAAYDPQSEGGVRHDDPLLAIAWPRPVTEVSDRDRTHPWLSAAFAGLSP